MKTLVTASTRSVARMVKGGRLVAAAIGIFIVIVPQLASAQVWSNWLNRDKPGGKGDYETIADFIKEGKMPCPKPTAVECRVAGTQQMITTGNPPGYTCNTTQGGFCANAPGVVCKDLEVRFSCPATGPISLPPVGTTTNCAQPAVVVSGMHYPSQTCAQTQSQFTSSALTSNHLTSKCPAGQPLKGVYNITCQDAPIPGFSTGSVYQATACCSVPTATIANLPMQGGNQNTPCPQIGVALPRAASSSVPYLAIMLANLDQQCSTKGSGFKLQSIKFLTCAPDPRGPGFGPNATADITCGP